ncbi:hypothetical protein GCM10010994_29300 [Chelatococcus reniformis]|uniref:Uncharacterized protein n=1 Tax=Chelatococcus reniformis TaxID=1494448 RepID=A0A916XGI2_9HYPH|nr:hypothetical protein GCM10010994_29300 [Chelatococcus reniformis]
MTIWRASRWLLAIFAVASLALSPASASMSPAGGSVALAHPPDASSTHHPEASADGSALLAIDDMPCCPPAEPVMPDCQKDCPLAALCVAKVAPALPGGLGIPVRLAVAQPLSWAGDPLLRSLTQPPPPEPPRA